MTLRSLSRRGFLASPLAALIPGLHASSTEYRFHHDHVMGTSLDLAIAASESDAQAAHSAIFDEITRLSKVLSTYDRDSEISRFNARGCTGDCSPDLSQVLSAYEHWHERTSGAIDARIGGMVAAWR